RPHRLVEEDELLDGGAALTAVLGGPADPEPPVLPHLPDDLTVRLADAVAARERFLDLGRQQLLVVRPQLAAHLLLLLAVPDVHQSSKLQARRFQNAGAHAGGEAAVDDERVSRDERRVLRRKERGRRRDLLGPTETAEHVCLPVLL